MAAGILDRDFLHWDLKRGDLKIVDVPELRMQYDSLIIHNKEKTLSSEAQALLTLLRDHRERPRQSRTAFAVSRSLHGRSPSSGL
jgi:hypothetical protein